MSAQHTPQRKEGWKFAGSAGDYHVWHAGKNDYRVTDGIQGHVIVKHDQFGKAHSAARWYYDNRRAAIAKVTGSA